jgi:hypothetical protein
MALIRAVLNFMVAGALLGVLSVSVVGPRFIEWDNTAGSGSAAMCLCRDQARLGADKLVSYQMQGCAAGAVLGMLMGVVFMMVRRKKPVAAA